MKDVDACLRDGYSTAGTAGTGLGAVSQAVLDFRHFLRRGPGHGGAVADCQAGERADQCTPRRDRRLEFGAICVAVAGEIECGDAWRIAENTDDSGGDPGRRWAWAMAAGGARLPARP